MYMNEDLLSSSEYSGIVAGSPYPADVLAVTVAMYLEKGTVQSNMTNVPN